MAAQRKTRQPRREKPQQIADELRTLIVTGQFAEGELLGREPELVERFAVSRPSLREALRILEAEGLITVVRGVHGGVVAQQPNERMTARTAALVLQARGVPLADVFQARAMIELLAVRGIGDMRSRRNIVAELRRLVDAQHEVVEDPEGFATANAAFHQRLVALGENQTLAIVAEMLNEILTRAVMAVSSAGDAVGSIATRRRGIRSQERLLELLQAGEAVAAEEHWQNHMRVVGRVLIGSESATVIDQLHHY